MENEIQIRPKSIRPILVVCLVCITVLLLILILPAPQKNPTSLAFSNFNISNICELATLKNYYHNVAMFEVEQDETLKVLIWPFSGLAKIGYKQYWIEYSGIVETGIDASLVRISSPDKNGVVSAYVPDAKVLNVYADESTMSAPLSESGWFTTITGEDKAEAFASAQNEMRQLAEEDQSTLNKAKENAKMILERYIINTGKSMGIELTVCWMDE